MIQNSSPGHQEMSRRQNTPLGERWVLLTHLHSVLCPGHPCSLNLGLMPAPMFSRDFLCISFVSPAELFIVFEARDCILCFFRHPTIYFHSEYLMESWHLKVESDSLKFSCLTSHPCRIPLCISPAARIHCLGHLQ